MKKILFLVLFMLAFAQVQAPLAFADAGTAAATPNAAALAAREADLLSRLHGARSHRGMLVNDVARLPNIELKPFKLSSGEYMLKPVDAATQRILSPESMSHPSVKAYMREVGTRRFSSLDQAASSAPAHKGWLTRTAGELERSLRGRQGGLQNQINRVRTQQAELNAPPKVEVPKPATNAGTNPKPATGSGTNPKPVVEATNTPPATGSGQNAPAPKTGNGTNVPAPKTGTGTNTAAASRTVVPNGPATTGTLKTGSGAPPPTLEGPAPSTTAGAGTTPPPAAPTTMMGRARSAMSSGLKGTVKALPVILATSLAVDMANQYRKTGTIDAGAAVKNMMTSDFLSTMGGGIAGGLMGTVAGTLIPGVGPFARLIKAGLMMGGAAMGANFAGGQEIDWKRLAFTTAITAAVSLAVPGGIFGAVLLGGTSFGADVLYDKLFGTSKPPARTQARQANGTGNGSRPSTPAGTGAGTTAPAAPPSPAPQQQAQVTPAPAQNQAPARTIRPPDSPDKDPMADINRTMR